MAGFQTQPSNKAKLWSNVPARSDDKNEPVPPDPCPARVRDARATRDGGAHATPDDRPIAVTPDNFVRAESDLYFSGVVKDGGFGKFLHRREPRRS